MAIKANNGGINLDLQSTDQLNQTDYQGRGNPGSYFVQTPAGSSMGINLFTPEGKNPMTPQLRQQINQPRNKSNF